jgi:hypothetical protein
MYPKTDRWAPYLKNKRVIQKIELNRAIKKEEFRKNPDRWNGLEYCEVKYTHGFENHHQLLRRTKEFLPIHFPGFTMVIKDHT